jgi:3',5'-cyclic AMP phosphodiesterase CpdA
MRPTQSLAFVLLFVSLFASLFAHPSLALHSSPFSFFHVSDIHYDPLGFPELYNASTFCREKLEELPEHYKHTSDGTDALMTSGEFGRYGCDTPASLLNSTFAAMRNVNPSPDFIIFTGDAPAHGLSSEQQLTAIQHVASIVSAFFPNTLLIPSIGNNDVYPDYSCACSDPRMELIFTSYLKWIPANQSATFLKMGAFAISPVPGLRVVSINTILYSVRNSNSSGMGTDPCGQFAWLKSVLDDAQAAKEKVYIVGHILPGLDPDYLTPLWVPQYSSQFVDLVLQYGDTIYASLYGHIHRDEFRILSPSDKKRSEPQNWSLLTASSISPVFDNNPTFRMYYFNDTFELMDYDEYYMDLYLANLMGVANWTMEYSYSDSYKQNSLSTSSLNTLYSRLQSEPTLFSQWYDRRVGQFVDSKLAALCVLNSPDSASFLACIANQGIV